VTLNEKCKCGAKKIINAVGLYCCPKCGNATLEDIARTQMNWNRDLPFSPKLGMTFCIWWDLSLGWLPGDQISNCHYFAALLNVPFELLIRKKWRKLFPKA
jgi:hypothetical protein